MQNWNYIRYSGLKKKKKCRRASTFIINTFLKSFVEI